MFAGLVGALAGCAASRSAWVTLSPVGHAASADIHKVEKTLRGVTVSAKLLQGRTRYLAQIEIHNGGKKKPVHGPDDVVLQDGSGLIQPALTAEDLKQEIHRHAASEATYSIDYWPHYYYIPQWIYYGHGRYRYTYVGPFYHDDWFERRLDAERILVQADRKIASIDADYLRSRDIPPQGSLTGFVQFAKKPEKGAAAGPLKLSLAMQKKVFIFEFMPAFNGERL